MGYKVSLDTAIKIAKDFRLSRQKLVFTHGAFDLFHAGHSIFLNKSKKTGEILVVGVEPDSNVRKYKGKLRPIIPQKQREEMILHHKAVDFVVTIDELDRVIDDYYVELYKTMKPTTVTFGKNFTVKDRKSTKVENVKFKEIVGEVSSTTKIITSIMNRYQDIKE